MAHVISSPASISAGSVSPSDLAIPLRERRQAAVEAQRAYAAAL